MSTRQVRALAALTVCLATSGYAGELRAQSAALDTVGACWTYVTPDARFRAVVVARGLTVPVSLAFLSDTQALVAERPVGRLDYVSLRTGALTPIQGTPPVVGEVDGGLLDIVLHPDFAHNRWIYYAYAERTDSGNAAVVERARLDGTHLIERTRLLSVHPYIANVNQFGARLVLDRGYLYVAIGDRELPERAQDLSTDLGKIVRLREDGSVPDDNPFVHTPGALPEIWSLGHRNSHGLAIDVRTGELWEHEHGPRGGDEINVIRPGRNYGWPVITYGIEYTGEPVGAGLTHREGMEQPVYYYVPSIAPTGMAFYTGTSFPRWRNDIFLGSLSYRHLNRVVLKSDRVVREERLLRDRGWRIREVRQGLDGFLYLGVESGLLVRIEPATSAHERGGCARGAGATDPWTIIEGASTPFMNDASPAHSRAIIAYDADARRAVWLGGGNSTYEWDGVSWSAIAGATPSSRTGAAMATDPSGGVLLFGGMRDGHASRDTWHYASHRWAQIEMSGPSARSGAAMTFDLDHHRTLLRGGAPCTDRRMWSWSGTEWTIVDSSGPPARQDASMTYDLSSRSVVLAGGRDCAGAPVRDSWRWSGTRWSRLEDAPASRAMCLVYSATLNRMLLFAIDSLRTGTAWRLEGSRWLRTIPAPPALRDASCVADPRRDRIVLAGRPPGARDVETLEMLR